MTTLTFFGLVLHAMFTTTLTALYQLHDRRTDVLGIHTLLTEAAAPPLAGSSPPPEFSAELARYDVILDKIKLIRHKLLAHRDSKLSSNDVFLSAALPLSEIDDLLALTRHILRSLRSWLDPTLYADDDQDAAADTKALIETLRQARREGEMPSGQ